jgi:hypothetical protein
VRRRAPQSNKARPTRCTFDARATPNNEHWQNERANAEGRRREGDATFKKLVSSFAQSTSAKNLPFEFEEERRTHCEEPPQFTT